MYHKAALVNDKGQVSALCFARPRAIDMKRVSWTNQWNDVTCPKCLKLHDQEATILGEIARAKARHETGE
jgi:hypothetical protein